ncbi:MAG: TPM domain-containing protein [Myxococcota bacterium]
MALLDEKDLARIAAAVKRVEENTAGEIVVVVEPQCDTYGTWRALGAALFTLAVSLGVHLFIPGVPEGSVLAAQLPLGLFAWWLCGLPRVLIRLAPQAAEMAAVDRQAKLAFLENGVHRTRDRSGILVFIAEAERRVEILADEGIHQRMGEATWQQHVDAMIGAIRSGRAADGICEQVEAMGRVLAQSFPRRPDDTNELPDTVRH